MSPMLRGEALPLPAKELSGLRDGLERHYGERVVPTSAGPLLAIRVPHREPDFLRDLEAAVDALPYRDLKGFRGVLLVGDKGDMGVSIDMLRSLMEARERSLRDWIQKLRGTLAPGDFHLGRLPTDPQRRLRAAFRVPTESVTDLEEPDFLQLAELLPDVKARSPGQVRPAIAYLVAEDDHVQLDGAAFFTDLERRRRYDQEREAAERRRVLEERHEMALAHLDRIMRERGEPAERRRAAGALYKPRPDVPTTEPARPPRAPTSAPPPHSAPRLPPPPEPSRAPAPRSHHPVDDLPTRAAPPPAAAEPDRFADMARHPETVVAIRKALDAAGYKTKHRLMVRDLPFAFAAARPDGYPTRVLVTFRRRLDAETAHRLILVGRSVGAELVLAVSEEVAPEAHKVVLATNVKPLTPEAALDVRFG